MIASGLRAASWDLKSSLFLMVSGWAIGIPNLAARAFTGDGARSRPRPDGLSNWVTARRILYPASASLSRVGTLNAGVPQKTRLRDRVMGAPNLTILQLSSASGSYVSSDRASGHSSG